MPYTEPSSPVQDTLHHVPGPSHRRPQMPSHSASDHSRHFSPSQSDPFWTSPATQPMPGLPRRNTSSSGSSTPRRQISPPVSRQPSATSPLVFPSSRPMEAVPRRATSALGVTGHGVSSRPQSSVSRPCPTRANKESVSSTSTLESMAPDTPTDTSPGLEQTRVQFPTYERHKGLVKSPAESPPADPSPAPMDFNIKPIVINQRRGRGTLGNGSHHHHRPAASLDQHTVTSVASSSALMQSGSWAGNSPVRPTMNIRKKSGELVKPSLKQRSLSTPDLPLRGPPSEPPTPDGTSSRDLAGESKSVRFAGSDDSDGRRLENVVLFLREQKVTAVSRAADPNADAHTETETEDTDGSEFVHFRTRRNAAAHAVDDAERISFADGGSRVPRCRLDFAPDARGSLRGENVLLERVELQQALGPLQFRGTVLVRNVAYQKWVAVRFTMDHWQTVSEVSGAHVCHIPASTTGDEGWDRFSFAIKLEDFKHKLDERQMLMCVRFSVEGKEWWDSNTNGENYRFTFKKVNPRKERERHRPRPHSAHSFQENYLRLNEPAAIPHLRTTPNPNSLASSSHAFDPKPPRSPNSAPAWSFPVKLAPATSIERTNSPMQSPPPPAAFQAPRPPDVHAHLQLSKYCAPSPPLSPPHPMHPNVRHANDTKPNPRRPNMELFAGQYATLAAPNAQGRDLRRSWNSVEDWGREPTGSGDETPRAELEASPLGVIGNLDMSASEESDAPSIDSPKRPLMKKASTPDLRHLVGPDHADTGLITPPSSNLSSPPTPSRSPLPPWQSTGDSSPVESLATQGSIDFGDIVIDPAERGRRSTADGFKTLNGGADSYDELIKRFCFFQPSSMTPDVAPSHFTRPSFIPLSGQSSPNGFPFFTNSNSARNTPTPTGTCTNSADAFDFGGSTPNNSAPNGPGFQWKAETTRKDADDSPSLSSSAAF